MSKENNLTDFLTDVADAIRKKKGTSEKINPQNFSEEIKNLPSGEEVNTFGEVMVDKTGGGSSDITSVVISNDVETIYTGAYRYFSNLKQVEFGDSIKSIEQYSFNYCEKLESVVLPKSISSISQYAFSQCVNLRHFEIPIDAPITIWSRDLLCNSPLLRSIVIPKNITYFNEYSIEKCTGVKCIDLSSCLAIPKMENVNAFTQTTGQFIVPDALYDEWIVATNWSAYADRIVKASEYVYIDFADPVVEEICAENFGDGIGTTQAQANAVTTFPNIFKGNTEITSFDEFENFENATSIALSAFEGCSKITTVKIPNNVSALPQTVFVNCSSLERVEISNNSRMSKIGFLCFDGCRKLTSINIPSGVTDIDFYAFRKCESLTKVTCRNSTPPTLGTQIFSGVPISTLNIYVPDESVGAYKSATNWAQYADSIRPLSEYQSNNE